MSVSVTVTISAHPGGGQAIVPDNRPLNDDETMSAIHDNVPYLLEAARRLRKMQ